MSVNTVQIRCVVEWLRGELKAVYVLNKWYLLADTICLCHTD